MKVIGKMECRKVKVHFTILTAIYTLVNFVKIVQMDTVNINMQMDKYIEDSGKMISKMDLEKKSFKMVLNMKACLRMGRNGVRELIGGLIIQCL